MNKVSNCNIIKRTFEGKINKDKNNSPITSEYSPSKKFALIFDVEFSHGGVKKGIIELYESKKEAQQQINLYNKYGY